VRFRVVSASATAVLTFHTETVDQSEIADGKVSLVAVRKGSGTGSLPGRALVRLKGHVSERVKSRRRSSDTSPYQEQTCANVRKIGGRGGVTLRRIGSKVEARWAFPQARVSFCHGPGAGSNVTSLMKKVYPASRFARKTVILVLAGSKTTKSETATVTYRWHATVKLARS